MPTAAWICIVPVKCVTLPLTGVQSIATSVSLRLTRTPNFTKYCVGLHVNCDYGSVSSDSVQYIM